MKYDVIVIGGGSAGCTIASRLSEDPDRSVLLLEAGPDYPDFEQLPDDLKLGNNVWLSAYGPHNWGYTAQLTDEQSELIIPRGKATGGSSAVNGQVLFRGIPEDYDRWAEWGNDEWGFTRVLPYFKQAGDRLGLRWGRLPRFRGAGAGAPLAAQRVDAPCPGLRAGLRGGGLPNR